MKLIDSDKLIAKIVELRKELPNTIEHLNDEESGFARGQQYELTAIEAEILCLQQEQPEVDLEKEIDDWYNTTGIPVTADALKETARHFYGLRNRALEESAQHVYESWMGGTMDDVRRDMVDLGKVLNARKEDEK